jgi:hypothetical protein
MVQKYFIDSWLLPCSLRSHRTANPTPKNGLRHFSALPTHHPKISGADTAENKVESIVQFNRLVRKCSIFASKNEI